MRFARCFAVVAVTLVAGCSGGASSVAGAPQTVVPAAALAAAPSPAPPSPSAAPSAAASLAIAGYEPGVSSVKVDVLPVPGARDYRLYDPANPSRVAYAGLVAPPSGRGPLVPSTRIEWDGIAPGGSATLVAEAVDALGPYPIGNLASFDPPLPEGCLGTWRPDRRPALAPLHAPPSEATAVAGLGAGAVPSGIAIGGQGCPANEPRTIARSTPFTVRASEGAPIPSSPSATAAFFESFTDADAATLRPIVAGDPEAGTATLTVGTQPTTWTILEDGADVIDSNAFILDGHLIDVLYDGASASGVAHARRASLAVVPNATADLAGGRILHATMRLDARVDSHRSLGIELAPAGDPLTGFAPEVGAIDRSDTGLFISIVGNGDGAVAVDEFVGPRPGAASGVPAALHLAGAPGTAPHDVPRAGPDRGLGDRVRFDVFVSTSHLALFEDGTRLGDVDFPRPLPFAQTKLYFTHFLSHSAAELGELRATSPLDAPWVAFTPFSDTRHWNDLGFETLPASTAWNALGALIRIPQRQAVSPAN